MAQNWWNQYWWLRTDTGGGTTIVYAEGITATLGEVALTATLGNINLTASVCVCV